MTHPLWLDGILSEEDSHGIERAVVEVERGTNAEIVPVLVKRSMPSWLARRFIFLGIAALLFFATGLLLGQRGARWVNLLLEAVFSALGGWPDPDVFFMTEIFVSLVVLAGALVSVAMASWGASALVLRAPSIERWLLPQSVLQREAIRRAEIEFSRSNIRQTQRRTGILLFVSFFERQMVILADHAFTDSDGAWSSRSQEVVDSALGAAIPLMAKGETRAAFLSALKIIGDHLREVSPAVPHDNPDELTNRIRFSDAER